MMSHLPDDELLSAYLDGELSSDEHLRVEDMLAASPEARQLVDELRALSSTLRGVPAEPLGDSLVERVLRIAERRTLAGADAEIETDSSADKEDHRPVWAAARWPSVFRRRLEPRTLLWPAAAVAVAVVIMLAERRDAPPVPTIPAGNGNATSSIVAVEEDTPAAGIDESSESPADASTVASSAVLDQASPEAPEAGSGDSLVVRLRVDERAVAERELAEAIARFGGSTLADDRTNEPSVEAELTGDQLRKLLAELKSSPDSMLVIMEPADTPGFAEPEGDGEVEVRNRTGSGGDAVGSGSGIAVGSGGIQVRIRPHSPLERRPSRSDERPPLRVRFVLENGN